MRDPQWGDLLIPSSSRIKINRWNKMIIKRK
jgi:hypothetical protein